MDRGRKRGREEEREGGREGGREGEREEQMTIDILPHTCKPLARGR